MTTFDSEGLYDLLWQVTAQTHLIVEADLAGSALTAASGSMLVAIAAEPGITVAEISRRIPKTQQTISQVVARLEKLGLIERRLGTGRGVGLHATTEGSELAVRARSSQRSLESRLTGALGDEGATALTELLRAASASLRER